jgi:signal peptidase II
MKGKFDFDTIKNKVKGYFVGYANDLKTDKSLFKKFLLISGIEFLLLAFTIVFDLCMKEFLYDFLLKHNGNYVVIKGFLDLTYSENTGAGFGMFKDGTLGLTVITAIIIVAIFAYLLIAKRKDIWLRISLVLIAGGGIGNLVDRIGLGYVRDFFEFTFMDFAIFNIADFFVTVGASMLIFYLIYLIAIDFIKGKDKKAENSVLTAENHNDTENNSDK